MRIAQVAPLQESVPPQLYGGTERVVSYLTEDLVRRGHDVTLFASGDSATAARLVAGCPRALWQDPECRETLPHHVRLVELVARAADQFDLLHFHLDHVHFPVIPRFRCPTVTTLHGSLVGSDQRAFFDAFPDVPLVSISDDQRRPIPRANWRATVYHGLPLNLHTPREDPGSYLAFLGRVSPEKGLDKAIEIARRAGLPLRVAAKIYPEERPYFERVIEPLLRASSWVEFIGEVGGPSKDAFLGGARALLFPIEWAEPFGLVMIEAMACGTPVVAFRRGSVPEVMIHGTTGFVVDDVPEAVAAVAQVAGLDRRVCRDVFARRFAADRMARDYEAVYRQLIAGQSRPPAPSALAGSLRHGTGLGDPVDPSSARGRHDSAARSPDGESHDPPRSNTNPRGIAPPSSSLESPPMAEPSQANPGRPPEGDPHHVLAAVGVADDRTRVLKHGDTFAVFDHLGHFTPGGLGEQGLYHEGTRYLSSLILELDGRPASFLGSTVRDQNDQLSVALTNLDRTRDGLVEVPLGTLHLAVRTMLWRKACHWRLRVKNHGQGPVATVLRLRFGADFADIFEVRGMARPARGNDLPPEVEPGRVVLGYVGLDGGTRRTLLRFTPAPAELGADQARFDLAVRPQEEVTIDLALACRRWDEAAEPPSYDAAEAEAGTALERLKAGACRVHASEGRFDAWLRRSESDLHMLTSDLPTGPYPYAGVPWFNTPFGRDGIITALQCLWLRPELARGVLTYLAATQATEVIPEQDAEPGKILHETRNGEMATLGEMPFGHYYGSVDATPLFVVLAGAYYERTADLDFAEVIWPHVTAALHWISRYGDRDRDGFVEYARRAVDGLLHQGWKDSDDAVSHADGTLATGPIALAEVQAYVHAARQAGAVLATALGMTDRAATLHQQAAELRERFEAAFWSEDLGTYAMALDGAKRPCRVRSSNAGQCLFGGIAAPDRAARVALGLLAPEAFSGWGIRTLAATEARFNPMAYHNGTIWPHDNALIAWGAARYGLKDLPLEVLSGLFGAVDSIDMKRMPELFCGFDRVPGEGPVPYPVACAPQAWSAGSVFLLLQACLGLEVSALERRIWFCQPRLPSFLTECRITNLQVAGATVDLLLVRHGDDVGVNVLRREGEVAVVVVK